MYPSLLNHSSPRGHEVSATDNTTTDNVYEAVHDPPHLEYDYVSTQGAITPHSSINKLPLKPNMQQDGQLPENEAETLAAEDAPNPLYGGASMEDNEMVDNPTYNQTLEASDVD